MVLAAIENAFTRLVTTTKGTKEECSRKGIDTNEGNKLHDS
jgi:hypothetical protein